MKDFYDCHGGPGTTEPACGACVTCLHRVIEANDARIKQLEDVLETAWGLIANVSQGDWTKQHPDWQEAVVRWRDTQFHPAYRPVAERKAREAKEQNEQ